jgi:putative spermidine/putrescine transport system ATP-binding protein
MSGGTTEVRRSREVAAQPAGLPVGVTIRAASKLYGAFRALDRVSLEVAPGEFVSLLGPSGSGKTTLLGVLGGFIPPTSGSVHFGDRDVTWLPMHQRDIGIVFQGYALFPHMTVGENVAFPLRARRLPRHGWRGRVADALGLVGLAGFEDRRVTQLSGGQRQRVAVARAVVFGPRLILMDEPLSALDKQLRESMQIELRRLHRRLAATIIYVTHDQREALTMSDRVAIMQGGRLVQIDTPERLHDRPADAFVAGFIGEATLLAVERRDVHAVALGACVLHTARPLPAADSLALAVHAGKLVIAGDTGDAALNLLAGRVIDTVYQGDSLKVIVALPDGQELALRQPTHHAARGRVPAPGAPITLALHREDTIVVPRTPT